MGFYDDLLAEFERDQHARQMVPLLRQAKVIHCGNVFEYYAHQVEDSEAFNKQLGALVPPFDLTFLEMHPTATLMIAGEEVPWLPDAFTRAGIFVRSYRQAPGWRLKYTMFLDMPTVERPSGPGWVKYPYIVGHYDLSMDGSSADHATELEAMPGVTEDHFKRLMTWQHAILADVMLLAFSFMNCKNVALDAEQPSAPPRTAEDRRLNHWPKAEHEFHTIRIMPFREVTKGATSGAPQSAQRLHIVRGHFAEYTEGKPLFGNPALVGKFWIPQHARGQVTQGEIDADYDVETE